MFDVLCFNLEITRPPVFYLSTTLDLHTVLLESVGYEATECMVANAYGRNDHNLYRLEAHGHIEFLDDEKQGVPANFF